jgi:urease accessory protein
MRFPLILSLILLAAPALAHHPLDGAPMQGFADGLMSGVGHPVLGVDHLFFVLVMGVAATLSGAGLRGIAGYVAAMLTGCLLVVSFGAGLPLQEAVIALSLVTLGLLVAAQKALSATMLTLLFAGFGLFHGGAFAAALTGQEGAAATPVLLGYLLGLGATQVLLALTGAQAARRLQPMTLQLGSAMVAGAGVLLVLESAEALAFS